MKTWMKYTLVVLFTLIALAAVGMAGFRYGMMQSATFTRPALQAQQNGDSAAQPQAPFYDDFPGGRGFSHMGYGNHMAFGGHHGFGRGGSFGMMGGGFFSPIFGLVKLAVIGLLVWLGYKLVKNSGWKLVKTAAADEQKPSA